MCYYSSNHLLTVFSSQHFRTYNLCERYPEYKVFICGVGNGPDGQEHLGMCSQLACFVHQNALDENTIAISGTGLDHIDESAMPIYETIYNYRELHKHSYPFSIELRSQHEIILDEVKYFINRYTYTFDYYFNSEKNIYEFPLKHVYNAIKEAPDIDELRDILRDDEYNISSDDNIIVQPPDSSNDSFSDGEYYYSENVDANQGDQERPENTANNGAEEEW